MPAAFIDQAKNKRADPVAEINRGDNFYQLQPGDGFLQRAQGDHKSVGGEQHRAGEHHHDQTEGTGRPTQKINDWTALVLNRNRGAKHHAQADKNAGYNRGHKITKWVF